MPQPSEPKPSTILLVDDDESIQRLYGRTLRDAGFEVETAGTGMEALDRVVSRRFELIVSDINLPGLDGVRLLRAIRRSDLDVPVILITGFPNVETAVEALDYGAVKYLTKPIEPAALVEAVEHALRMGRLAVVKRQALELLGEEQRQIGDRAALELAFEDALVQLRMVYQPIISTKAGRVVAYEALVRSDNQRLSGARALIEGAERLGRLRDLSVAVQQLIADDLDRHLADATIHVNILPNDLSDQRLTDTDAPLLARARQLVYEVTEEVSAAGLGDLGPYVRTLREHGFRIGLDDVGSGDAGLTAFAMIEPEVIKIDQSLIRGISEERPKQGIVKTILDLGKELGVGEVVVKGVETEAEYDTLIDLGADLLQGFFLGTPGAPERLSWVPK